MPIDNLNYPSSSGMLSLREEQKRRAMSEGAAPPWDQALDDYIFGGKPSTPAIPANVVKTLQEEAEQKKIQKKKKKADTKANDLGYPEVPLNREAELAKERDAKIAQMAQGSKAAASSIGKKPEHEWTLQDWQNEAARTGHTIRNRDTIPGWGVNYFDNDYVAEMKGVDTDAKARERLRQRYGMSPDQEFQLDAYGNISNVANMYKKQLADLRSERNRKQQAEIQQRVNESMIRSLNIGDPEIVKAVLGQNQSMAELASQERIAQMQAQGRRSTRGTKEERRLGDAKWIENWQSEARENLPSMIEEKFYQMQMDAEEAGSDVKITMEDAERALKEELRQDFADELYENGGAVIPREDGGLQILTSSEVEREAKYHKMSVGQYLKEARAAYESALKSRI